MVVSSMSVTLRVIKGMMELPVEGICVVTKLKGGAMFANFFNSKMMDKIAYAGVIQQDAMLDMLRANNFIESEHDKSCE